MKESGYYPLGAEFDPDEIWNIPTTNISKCCKGKRHSAGKYIWKYVR